MDEILVCECNSAEHQIVFEYDSEYNLIYCQIHLTQGGFWRRLKAGVKHIFSYKCRYGHWDEFLLSDRHADKLQEMATKLRTKGQINI